jgi:hypothetical protein
MRVLGSARRRVWRQAISCVVAYTFVLQIALLSFAVPRIAAFAADQDTLSAGLCLHDRDAPAAPVGNSDGEEHCKFCTAAAHNIFMAPAIDHRTVTRIAETAARPAGEWFISGPIAHATPQPRGPPRTA